MKKILFCFSCLLIFCFVFALTASAEGTSYAITYQAYIDKTGIYQSAYNNYLTARSAYLNSQNLNSKNSAQNETLKMLQARDNVMTSYLNAIKTKINNNQGITLPSKTSISNLINTEINWYQSHNAKLPSAGSLDDLVADSDEAKNQYQNSTLNLIYLSLINLGVGDNSYIRGEITNEINTLNAKISEIKANQDKDVSSVQRSVFDIQNKLSRSQDKDNLALLTVNSIKPGSNQKDNDFQNAISAVTDSNSYLKEANQELLQIITQIKTN